MRPLPIALAFAAAAAPSASAQQLEASLGGSSARHPVESRTVVAGAHYDRGGLHRTLLGAHYRDLWAAPVVVPLLDLRRFAGGLTPEERGGGQQTRSLELEGADGRTYAFRSLDKDPTPAVPPTFRGTVVHRLIRDAISAAHPGGPLIAARLLRSAGVLHVEPRLVLMPDDPALKEFRRDFPGVLGYIEEKPGDGFAGAALVIDSEALFERLDAGAGDRVDARAFLRARLMDQLLGDWDRHRDQWRWAGYRSGDGTIWKPIPRDRDQALVRYDGLLPALARVAHPKLVVFGPGYPSIVGLTWNGRDLDRRLLASLTAADFDSVAADLATRLNDAAIDSALATLPEPYRNRSLSRTRSALLARRDGLADQAGRYYRYLAEDVDVYTSDQPDVVDAEREPDGGLVLRIRTGAAASPHFERRFAAGETAEVRLHLRGGGDRVSVAGARRGGTLLRIIRDPARDSVEGAEGRGVRLHDPGPEIPETDDPIESGVPPRDWGSGFGIGPRARYDTDLGLIVGAQATRTDYAFRRQPYGSRLRLAAEYGVTTGGARVALDADLRRMNERHRLDLRAVASQLEVVRFTGLGNETPSPGESDFFEVDQWRFSIEPVYRYRRGPGLELHAGPIARYTTTRLRDDRLVGRDRPQGAEGFGRAGLTAGLSAETADTGPDGRRFVVEIGASAYPPLWSNRSTFGEAHAQGTARVPLGVKSGPVLALRLGAKQVWGPFPYDEAAYLGGSGNLRGYRYQRFAGDAALYGGAELRIPLARVLEHAVPTRIGVFALADAGRVWARGTTSRRVHAAGGGGAWLAFFDDRYAVSLALAASPEGSLWYLGTGMAY